MSKNSDEWTEIGEVGVDSGQVMVTDPSYINGEWKKDGKKEMDNLWDRSYVNPKGVHFKYGKDFTNYNEIVDGDTPNNHTESGNWTKVTNEGTSELDGKFSYGGCCKSTLNKGHGQLNYELGHAGAGVVVNSGMGDGVYPVYAKFVDDENDPANGRIAEIRIKFLPHPYF
jgi:hypothetical protein